jgi:4-amino-4-deoxy-L-arabinose transferase-like glycosyltransferase
MVFGAPPQSAVARIASPAMPARTLRWIRALPERYGRTTLILLAMIALLGLALRAYRVVEPLAEPSPDSHAYYALSKALYTEGSYGGPEFHDSSDWSPGAPLLYAAAFYATGGAREGVARIVEALLGVAAIVAVFFLGERISGRTAGLIAAFGVAVYPSFIHTTGELMSEPPAIFTLPLAVLSFLWACDRRSLWAWLLPGLLFGLTSLIRPDYLPVAAAFALLAAIRVGRERGWRPGLAGIAIFLAAFLIPVLPWTVRNLVVLERFVPISTGDGKALYVGTFLPADGEYQQVKALLEKRYHHRELAPYSAALEHVNPTRLFDRVANRYPELPRDTALGKIAKQDFSKYFGEEPIEYLAMTARKVGRIWSSGPGEVMSSTVGRALQLLIVALALAGLWLLARRRQWWELTVMATPIVIITVVGAISLASNRRGEILMTLVFPLAAAALSWGASSLLSSGSWPRRASSPQN